MASPSANFRCCCKLDQVAALWVGRFQKLMHIAWLCQDCRKDDTPDFPMQDFFCAEFSGIARGHVKPTLFWFVRISFCFSIFLFGSADPFLAVFCSLHPKHPKQVVDDLVARHKANPKQASTDWNGAGRREVFMLINGSWQSSGRTCAVELQLEQLVVDWFQPACVWHA